MWLQDRYVEEFFFVYRNAKRLCVTKNRFIAEDISRYYECRVFKVDYPSSRVVEVDGSVLEIPFFLDEKIEELDLDDEGERARMLLEATYLLPFDEEDDSPFEYSHDEEEYPL